MFIYIKLRIDGMIKKNKKILNFNWKIRQIGKQKLREEKKKTKELKKQKIAHKKLLAKNQRQIEKKSRIAKIKAEKDKRQNEIHLNKQKKLENRRELKMQLEEEKQIKKEMKKYAKDALSNEKELAKILKKQKKQRKKDKDRQNLTDLHIKNIQIIENLLAEADNKDGNFKNSDFDLNNIPDQIDSAILRYQPPEFLSTPPFQTNFVSKQEILEKMGSIKTSTAKIFDKVNVSQTKMTQLEEIDTILPEEDNSILKREERFDSPLISEIQFKDKKKPSKKIREKENQKWIFTGIKGFDKMLEKGIPAGSNIIVAGGPGSGKTIFCMQAIYNQAKEGKDCVFLSMEERPDRLMDHMLEFGFEVEKLETSDEQIILRANGKGKIVLKRLQPIRLARSIEALLEKASGTLPVEIDLVLDFIPEDFNACLLALDSISAIETAFSGTKRQYRIYIEQLFRYFEDMNITTFMITESSDAPHKFSNTGVEEFLADGIFVFYNFQGVKKRTRGVEIFKLRGASHSQRIVTMNITSKGIDIFSDESCTEQSRS